MHLVKYCCVKFAVVIVIIIIQFSALKIINAIYKEFFFLCHLLALLQYMIKLSSSAIKPFKRTKKITQI